MNRSGGVGNRSSSRRTSRSGGDGSRRTSMGS